MCAISLLPPSHDSELVKKEDVTVTIRSDIAEVLIHS